MWMYTDIQYTRLYTVFQKSDAKIKYPLSGFNYHLSDVNVANFNKIHRIVSEQQQQQQQQIGTQKQKFPIWKIPISTFCRRFVP